MSRPDAELIAGLGQTFTDTFGAEPEYLTWSPGRVNLIGDHTDYCDGFAMPMAVDRYSVCLSRRSPASRLRVISTVMNESLDLPLDRSLTPRGDWSDYLAGVLFGFQARSAQIPGMDLLIGGDLPLGAGLSSSASLEVSIALALEWAASASLTPEVRIALCQKAEHDFAGMPCGILDQFAVSHGEDGAALLLDCRAGSAESIQLPANPVFAVIDSGVRHALVDGGYAERLAQVRRVEKHLNKSLRDTELSDLKSFDDALLVQRARHVITENERVHEFAQALSAGDGPAAGSIMLASQRSLAEDYAVSCPEVDALVDACMAAGALGARMTGGGFGGSVIALVPATMRDDFGASLRNTYAGTGCSTPVPLWLSPVAGANGEAWNP